MAVNKKIIEVSVVVPIFNEAKNIEELIIRLEKAFSKAGKSFEIIFVDDISSDGTPEIIQKYKSEKILYLAKKGKKGKAYSLIEGFREARGEILVMIDGDLQYPPEAIPGMIEGLKDTDIVIASRKSYKDSIARKVLSNTFRFAFGKLLFGLNHDIQSGLKVFRREVFEAVPFNPSSQWTFDLEFLHRARHAGFTISDFDIVFAKRSNGHSSVDFIKTTLDIGLNTLLLKFKDIQPVYIRGKDANSMLGAGIGYKKKRYITHTTMPHKSTALVTFTDSQKNFISVFAAVFIAGLIASPLLALQIIVAILSFIYFVDVLFNLFVIMKSLSFPQEITSSEEEIAKLKDKDLPVYTILCPLYREVHVVPQFMQAIGRLSYPKDKLDVLLLLEEDDKDTIDKIWKMRLPKYVRVIVVPHSFPKTKPKACNYGLSYAKGEYLVIYDAEDIPEPTQLKKAFLGFQKVPSDTICLQAKLNYYNPHQNLLTRFFTAEYSLWFDVTLTGLQSINTTIPLGGTSNHFRTKHLKLVEGWDPFNVTEDADLGMRLFKKGYKTAIIDSVTLEEANSRWGNWLRQRSRWIKGYMQTYLVHIRELFSFARARGHHSLIFQLIIGGKIAFVLINPILWIATIAYFTLYRFVGPQIEALYPSVVFYMAITSLVFGNFLFLYYYMIGVAKKGQWNLMKFVFFIPFYWIMISVAASIALYQLIFKPHYWEKTVHGFHLLKKKEKEVLAEAVIEAEESDTGFLYPKNFRARLTSLIKRRQVYFGGMLLVGASFVANFLNFAFNAYLGRVLEFRELALVSLMGGLFSFSSILFGAFSTTANFKSGFLIGKFGDDAGYSFWKYIRKIAIFSSLAITIIWILAIPLLENYFDTDNPYLFVFFGLILLVGLINAANRGFLSSKLMFGSIAAINFFDPVIKLLAVVVLVYFGFKTWSFAAIPLGVLGTFIVGWILIIKQVRPGKHNVQDFEIKRFPIRFFSASMLAGFSSVSFLTVDVLLANHFLSHAEVGKYALLSLVGKMIYFMGGLTTPFIVPLISRNEGANKSSHKTLYALLVSTATLSLGGFLVFGLFGNITIPILYGKKAVAIVPYLTFFTFGAMCYTVSKVFVNYYLVKRVYTLTILTSLLAVFQLLLISMFHNDVGTIAMVMSFVWGLHLLLTAALHLGAKHIKVFENNFRDYIRLFSKNLGKQKENKEKFNILIFNWRDTKHKWAGGAEVYVHELAKRWAKDGNNVTIFSGRSNGSPRNEVIDGVQIYRRGGFISVYLWAALYYIFKFRGKFDVIIDSENGIPFFTPLYTGTKKFLLIHHVHQEVFRKSLKKPLSWIALFLEAKLMPLVYRNVQVITVSPSSKEEIVRHKFTKKEPIVIYNGVDLKAFTPGEKSKKPMVLYLGRLQYYKSLHVFLVAAKKILKTITDTEFVIAGEGEEKIKLQKFAKELGILEKIKFVGKVSEAEKIKLYQKAWVFVNPSFMEGWGITAIEAAACGTPAVASDVPGLRDSINNTHTGILIPYGKYEEFARSIKRLIEDEKLRKEMSKKSIDWAQDFNWDISAKKFFALLTERELQERKVVRVKNFSYLINRIMSVF